jgi:hypothetical protein
MCHVCVQDIHTVQLGQTRCSHTPFSSICPRVSQLLTLWSQRPYQATQARLLHPFVSRRFHSLECQLMAVTRWPIVSLHSGLRPAEFGFTCETAPPATKLRTVFSVTLFIWEIVSTLLIRESLLLGGTTNCSFHQGNPPPTTTASASPSVPAAQQPGLPFQATPIKPISQSALEVKPGKESPARSVVDSFASSERHG